MEGLIVLAFAMTLLAFPLIVFVPVFARDVFHGGPNLYTVFLVCSGCGSITGALVVAGLGKHRHQGRSALVMLIVLGALITGFALSRNLVLSCVLIFLAGGILLGAFVTISSLVQMITSDQMRGRVMSVYNVAFRGGMPIGMLAVGRLIPIYTAPVTMSAVGALTILLGLYFLLVQRRVARL